MSSEALRRMIGIGKVDDGLRLKVDVPPGLPQEFHATFQKLAWIAASDPKSVFGHGLAALAKDQEAVRKLEEAHRTKALAEAGKVLGSLQASATTIDCADIVVLGRDGLRQLSEAATILEQMGIKDLSDEDMKVLKDSAVVSSIMDDDSEGRPRA